MVRPEAEMMVVAGASERERESEGGQQRLPPPSPPLSSLPRSLRTPVHGPVRNGRLFVVRCSMRDCVGRAEHGETRNGTEGEGAWGGLPGQAVCVLIDQHCCRIRLQRDGHIDWQSVSPGRNEACPPGKRFANANIVAPGSPSCCFSTDARGGGWETGRRGGGGKKNKKIPRRTFDIFDADIASPFFSPPLSFLPDL